MNRCSNHVSGKIHPCLLSNVIMKVPESAIHNCGFKFVQAATCLRRCRMRANAYFNSSLLDKIDFHGYFLISGFGAPHLGVVHIKIKL